MIDNSVKLGTKIYLKPFLLRLIIIYGCCSYMFVFIDLLFYPSSISVLLNDYVYFHNTNLLCISLTIEQFFLQVYIGSCICVSWVLCFHNMGWRGTCNMPRFYSSFKLSLVTCIFTNCSLICQGTYLTSAARSHSTDNNLHEIAVIGDFNGEFWAVYALHQVIILFLTED